MTNTIKYDVSLYGVKGDDKNDHFDLVRIERPDIVDKAGRKQWQKESSAEVRTTIIENVPITELGELLRAVAEASSYYVRGVSE